MAVEGGCGIIVYGCTITKNRSIVIVHCTNVKRSLRVPPILELQWSFWLRGKYCGESCMDTQSKSSSADRRRSLLDSSLGSGRLTHEQ